MDHAEASPCTSSPFWAFALEGFHFIFEKLLCWPMLIIQDFEPLSALGIQFTASASFLH